MTTDWVALDTETTGLGETDQIVEIAIVASDGYPLLNERIRPGVGIAPEAQQVHGISMEALAQAPQWPDIASRVQQTLEDRKIIIFNAGFDLRMMCQTIEAFTDPYMDNPESAAGWLTRLDVSCAMNAAAARLGATNAYGTISMADAVTLAGVEWQGPAHSALGDAMTTAALWGELAEH